MSKVYIKELEHEIEEQKEAANAMYIVIADIAQAAGIPESTPNLCRETAKAVAALRSQRDEALAELATFRARLREVTYITQNYFERRCTEVDGVFIETSRAEAHAAINAAADWLAAMRALEER